MFPKIENNSTVTTPVFVLETDGTVLGPAAVLVDPEAVNVYYEECQRRGLRPTKWSGNRLDCRVDRFLQNPLRGQTVRITIVVRDVQGHARMYTASIVQSETEAPVVVK